MSSGLFLAGRFNLRDQIVSVLRHPDEFAADGNYRMADEGLEYADKVLQLKNKLTDYRSELEKSDAP